VFCRFPARPDDNESILNFSRHAGGLQHRQSSTSARIALAGAIGVGFALLMVQRLQRADAAEPDLMQTLVAEDATLNNNLMPLAADWDKSREGRHTAWGFGLEKQLSERLGMTIDGQYDFWSPREQQSGTGFGNVDLQLKYVFLKLPEEDFAFALAPALSLPTNSHLGADPSYVEADITLAWGGRLGQLPNVGLTGYLRALEIQGDLGYSRLFDSKGSGQFFFDPVLDYSMPYLNYATAGTVSVWLRYFCPFIELNLDQPVGSGDGRPSDLFLMPGLALLAETYQASVGTQIALNHGTARDEQVAVVASILIFMDVIDPRFAWTPF
jgi:hypothetical protein